MVGCFAPDCRHNSENYECKFFKFPLTEARFRKWINLVRRADRQPVKNSSRLCSCHFIDGNSDNDPTIFHRNKNKLLYTPTNLVFSPKRRKVTRTPLKELNRSESENFHQESSVNNVTETPLIKSNQPDSGNSHQQSEAAAALEFEVHTCSSGNSHLQSDTSITLDLEALPSSSTTKEETMKLYYPNHDFSQIYPISELSRADILMLLSENYFLRQEVAKLKEQGSRFNLEKIKNDDRKIMFYTGFPNYKMLNMFFKLFEKTNVVYYYCAVKKIPRNEQIIMTLMKLRLNLGHTDLAVAFECSESLVTNIVITWIHVMVKILCDGYLSNSIPSTKKNKLVLPGIFAKFPNCRVILDCTEVRSQVPHRLDLLKKLYSSYKHFTTLKGLIGIAPSGSVTFISDLYPGSTGDRDITIHCGILKQLVPGDLVLADKGFLISDILPQGVHLNIPPFLCTPQFSKNEVELTQLIAQARVHVERAIRRIKTFKILNMIPVDYFPYASEIWRLCAALTNFRFPLLRELEEKYSKLDDLAN